MAVFDKGLAWVVLGATLLYLVQAVLVLVRTFRTLWRRVRGLRTAADGPLWMDLFWPVFALANLFISACFALLALAAVIGP